MGFDWHKYIEFSERIIQDNKGEECARISISRAYYGVFCICRDRVSDMLPKKKIFNVHKEVAYIYRYKKKNKKIYYLLKELRENRNIADYDGDQKINTELAKNIIGKANRILEILNKIDSH